MATAPTGAAPGPLLVALDRDEAEPLHSQIYGQVRRAILDGVLPPGTRLPSSRALAEDLDVSRTTTLLAFDRLAAEGYVTTRRGSGVFISHILPDQAPTGRPATRKTDRRHPPLSRRGIALGEVPRTALRAAPGVRPFRIGTPALDLFPTVMWSRLWRRRLQRATIEHLDYGAIAGAPALRHAIARHVSQSRATTCSAEQVVVFNGAQQALDLLARILLDPGDVAAIESPAYPGAVGALRAAGATISGVTVDDDGIDVAALARLPGEPRLVYVTPSHQFPVGVTLSLQRRLALLAWASRTGAWIVEDDYDTEFRYGGGAIPCLHGLDVDDRVVYVGTFSKTLFPSLRTGFLVVPPDLVDAVASARRSTDIHPSTLAQLVLADFIAEGHFARHLRRMRRGYEARLEALEAAVARHGAGALSLRPVAAGLHAVADLKGASATAVARLALERGIEVMPLEAYRVESDQPVDNALVLGFGAVGVERLDEGAAILTQAIEAARRAAPARRARSKVS